MQSGGSGGLTGKARRVRIKSRAARLHTQQLINEFLEPDWKAESGRRWVPIRHSADFRPSALESRVAIADEGEDQFAFPFDSGPAHDQSTFTERHQQMGLESPNRAIRPGLSESGPGPVPRNARRITATQAQGKTPGSVIGFLGGCGLGLLVGTVLLLLLRLMV